MIAEGLPAADPVPERMFCTRRTTRQARSAPRAESAIGWVISARPAYEALVSEADFSAEDAVSAVCAVIVNGVSYWSAPATTARYGSGTHRPADACSLCLPTTQS